MYPRTAVLRWDRDVPHIRATRSPDQRWTSPVSVWVDGYLYSVCWDRGAFDDAISDVRRLSSAATARLTY